MASRGRSTRKSFRKANDAGLSLRIRNTTDSVYSLSAFSKFLTASSIYRYLKDHWHAHGKLFLQRTLLYEKIIPSGSKKLNRGFIPRLRDEYGRAAKRLKLEGGNGVYLPLDGFSGLLSPKRNDVEIKPIVKEVVFEAIFDQSAVADTVDLDVLLIKTTANDVLKDMISENGTGNSFITMRVSRNPVQNGTGPNGHVYPSIPFALDVVSPLNLFSGIRGCQKPTKIYLLCRCKLALPRTGTRNGLRNSIQRRADAYLAPLTQEYCYGYCLIGDESSLNMYDDGEEIEIIMRRMSLNLDVDNGNGRVTNGHIFGPQIFSDLIANTEVENDSGHRTPVLRVRIVQSGVQQRRRSTAFVLPPTFKRNRLNHFCDKLPLQIGRKNMLPSMAATNSGPPLLYRFCVEYQQSVSVADCFQSCFTTRLNDPTRCPFCDARCSDLYAFLQHHRLSHPRWIFTLKETSDGYVIEIRPNLYYECRLEMFVSRKKLSRRKVVPLRRHVSETSTIFYRPKSRPVSIVDQRRSLDEFKTCPRSMEYYEAKAQAEFILNHSRQYYHSQTCQFVLPSEFDQDSDDEMDPEWLRNRMQRLIDDFMDVNVGEKAIMKMWNLHVMKYNFIGDCRMMAANESFLLEYGRRLVLENLTNNYLLHLANSHCNGILSQAQVLDLTKRLYAIKAATVGDLSLR